MSPLDRTIRADPPAAAPFRLSLGPAILYLDDIGNICESLVTFSQEKAGAAHNLTNVTGVVEIRALDARASDVEDLKDATKAEISQVSLESWARGTGPGGGNKGSLPALEMSVPVITVRLWSHAAEIIVWPPDNADARYFAEAMRDFVRTRRNWAPVLPRVKYPALIFLATLAFSILFTVDPKPGGPGPEFFILPAFVSLYIINIYPQRRSVVRVLQLWRKEGRRLSSQARREWLIALVSAIVGAAILGLLGLWAGFFVKK